MEGAYYIEAGKERPSKINPNSGKPLASDLHCQSACKDSPKSKIFIQIKTRSVEKNAFGRKSEKSGAPFFC